MNTNCQNKARTFSSITTPLLIMVILSSIYASASEYYVSLDGLDSNAGTKEAPFSSLLRARDAVRAEKEAGSLSDGGITIWIRGGTYYFDTPLQLVAEDSGTEDAPIVYRAFHDEEVIFDGSKAIDASHFQRVEDGATQERLCPAARGNVLYTVIEDTAMAKALSNPGTQLSFDGRMMQLARFPNTGYCHIEKILDKGAVYAHGRTLGEVPGYSMETPIGGSFTIAETPSGDWAKEFQQIQKADIQGYLSYDWYREGHRIASIQEGTIRLLEYSRYGILNREKIPRRLVVRNLLCELDQPGEWYFDENERTLFLWPFSPIQPETTIGYWSGSEFAILTDASHITIRDITVQCTTSGEAMIAVKGGSDNLIAGCTLRNSTRTGITFSGGKQNGIVGCDLYDLGRHLVLEGGDLKSLTPAGNYARNNHFTQVESRDFYGRVRVRGVGNIFQNNLLHNFVGQPIVISGNDHVFERNEIFNVGIEEGDGGAIYSGAQLWSYGNVFRHNFLHHLMCMPQAHPRGGIYPDDLDAGNTIVENIFYKAAHRAVLLNGGAANTVTHNIFIRGHIGVYSTEAWAQQMIEAQPKYDSGELKRGDKTDHIWRTEQVVGKEGWNRPPWSTKYPLFKKIMNQSERRFYPIECTVSHNLFCENAQNTAFRRGWSDEQLVPMEEVDYMTATDNREIPLDAFLEPECLDFSFKEDRKPESFPAIPFESIGLQQDTYRTHTPDKDKYRRAIAQYWEKRKCFDEEAVYDPTTVNHLIYFNTGKLVFSP